MTAYMGRGGIEAAAGQHLQPLHRVPDPEHQSTHHGYEVPEDEGYQDDLDPVGEEDDLED